MVGVLKKSSTKWIGLGITFIAFIVCIGLSIIMGYAHIDWHTVIDAYTHYNQSNAEAIVREARVPRALIAATVGASLSISGALMQALARNPLASPDILGVNAGASLFIVIAITFFSATSINALAPLAFLGAALASIIVYLLGSLGPERLSPVKLTLAGAAMAAFFTSMTQGILTSNEQTLDAVLFWLVGSVQGRDLSLLTGVLPYFCLGWIASLLIGSKMNTLVLGDNVAKGVGQNPLLVKAVTGIIIILLAGGSVAVAGPIGFIGIVIPHIAKWFVGQDYRWLIPYSALLGGILLLVADIAARYVIMPEEVPVGVMTAIVGTPFFIFIAKKGAWR
ncbi:FecCD family ABC transporter permease [Camelliibacillus cellulosilyticus]|uniref:FecCD family ABC transporter permease n=1 Tax=Camelliibacillus cellulosilyticus TaxID=2174486 RepID=A0ABV9GLY0_9BACL